MGILNFFKKADGSLAPNFSEIDSNEKAVELCEKSILVPLYLMPLRFGGETGYKIPYTVPFLCLKITISSA